MIKNNKEDCKWCNQGWIVCEEHGHNSKCNKYLNGHYKTIVLDQDETPPNPAPLPERIDKALGVLQGSSRQVNMPPELLAEFRKNARTQINLLLADFVNEVVGENDEDNGTIVHLENYGRNQLRAEIKQRTKDMLGEK